MPVEEEEDIINQFCEKLEQEINQLKEINKSLKKNSLDFMGYRKKKHNRNGEKMQKLESSSFISVFLYPF